MLVEEAVEEEDEVMVDGEERREWPRPEDEEEEEEEEVDLWADGGAEKDTRSEVSWPLKCGRCSPG